MIVSLRIKVANFRRRFDPIYIYRLKQRQKYEVEVNAPYERGDMGLFYPRILSLEETMRSVIDNRMSMCRYGDGEFEIAEGRDASSFQEFNNGLSNRLKEILANPIKSCLCCIPNIYESLDAYSGYNKIYWRQVAIQSRRKIFPMINGVYTSGRMAFGDSLCSRAYLGVNDKLIATKVFDLWKALFKDKNLLIVEGRYSRLGVGNDLMEGALSIRRIWCPATNAFDKYEEILLAVKENASKNDLVIIALGMTATVLAYDLANEGYWAVDAGHVDVEYMWMKMGVDHKVPIPGRYVNECDNGHEKVHENDEVKKYIVIKIVGC